MRKSGRRSKGPSLVANFFGEPGSTGTPSPDQKGSIVNDNAAVSAFAAWGMNVASSVGVIMANKMVMSFYKFHFATTLTAMHFSATAFVSLFASYLGFFPQKHVPFKTLFWFSLVADTSIVSMNLSLMLNSVGFYQIAKLSIIPTVCILEALINGKTFSRQVRISVLIVMLGVGICTITDVNVNPWGFGSALVAVISTSLQQIYIGSLQKKYSVTSFQLLSKTTPIQAISLIFTGPFIDYFLTRENILKYSASFNAIAFVGLSCLAAIFVNLSTYLCIGKFSAVSFQILGHMKTVGVLAAGWLFFDSTLTLKNVGGIGIAVIGMIMYSYVAEAESRKKAANLAAGASVVPKVVVEQPSESNSESQGLWKAENRLTAEDEPLLQHDLEQGVNR